jgi:hypothetical protein
MGYWKPEVGLAKQALARARCRKKRVLDFDRLTSKRVLDFDRLTFHLLTRLTAWIF